MGHCNDPEMAVSTSKGDLQVTEEGVSAYNGWVNNMQYTHEEGPFTPGGALLGWWRGLIIE